MLILKMSLFRHTSNWWVLIILIQFVRLYPLNVFCMQLWPIEHNHKRQRGKSNINALSRSYHVYKIGNTCSLLLLNISMYTQYTNKYKPTPTCVDRKTRTYDFTHTTENTHFDCYHDTRTFLVIHKYHTQCIQCVTPAMSRGGSSRWKGGANCWLTTGVPGGWPPCRAQGAESPGRGCKGVTPPCVGKFCISELNSHDLVHTFCQHYIENLLIYFQ